jgi:diaminopimelate epimerase
MQQIIAFTKVSGAGNDFVLIDNMDGRLDLDKTRLAIAVCSRHFGVGADGLLLVEPSQEADFFMRYYNADGSYGGMCGNGGRCVARYAYLHSIAKSPMRFMALDHTYDAEIIGQAVRLRMKDPSELRQKVPLQIDGQARSGHFVNTGSPHVVIVEKTIDAVDVERIGRFICHDKLFAPGGTNVNFLTISTTGSIELRTYERGVERETLACGTGAVASAVVAVLEHGLVSPIHVKVRSGEELLVHCRTAGGKITDVLLEGSAHLLFSGKLVYDPVSGAVLDIEEENSVLLPSASR